MWKTLISLARQAVRRASFSAPARRAGGADGSQRRTSLPAAVNTSTPQPPRDLGVSTTHERKTGETLAPEAANTRLENIRFEPMADVDPLFSFSQEGALTVVRIATEHPAFPRLATIDGKTLRLHESTELLIAALARVELDASEEREHRIRRHRSALERALEALAEQS